MGDFFAVIGEFFVFCGEIIFDFFAEIFPGNTFQTNPKTWFFLVLIFGLWWIFIRQAQIGELLGHIWSWIRGILWQIRNLRRGE